MFCATTGALGHTLHQNSYFSFSQTAGLFVCKLPTSKFILAIDLTAVSAINSLSPKIVDLIGSTVLSVWAMPKNIFFLWGNHNS